jgi:hypothetical protein
MSLLGFAVCRVGYDVWSEVYRRCWGGADSRYDECLNVAHTGKSNRQALPLQPLSAGLSLGLWQLPVLRGPSPHAPLSKLNYWLDIQVRGRTKRGPPTGILGSGYPLF